jgi:hypothetical protein
MFRSYGTLLYIIHPYHRIKIIRQSFRQAQTIGSRRSPGLHHESSLRDLHVRAIGSTCIVGTEFISSIQIITTNLLRAVGSGHIYLWKYGSCGRQATPPKEGRKNRYLINFAPLISPSIKVVPKTPKEFNIHHLWRNRREAVFPQKTQPGTG